MDLLVAASGGKAPAETRPMGSTSARSASSAVARPNSLRRTRARNDDLLQLAEDSGDFFYPVCSVHPADGRAALDEIDRVATGGAAWLKLHPNTQQFDVADPTVARVVKKAAENGLPVLFDASAVITRSTTR
jgi:predicted TIM-barrel fold metal-dependent hydrolase